MSNSFMNNDFDPDVLRRAIRRQAIGVNQQGFIRGRWTSVELWEGEAHRSRKLWGTDFDNGIVDVGIHYALDRLTDVGSPAAVTWYAGLMDNASYTGIDDSDTMSSHTGWIENQDYSEGVRQTLAFGAAAARTISDSVSFSIDASVTIKGLFVTSDNVKGGTTGTLFSTALFSTAPILINGNTLTANYSLSD
jgi:hypothetical protein